MICRPHPPRPPSFCPLPGDAKVLPGLVHARLGELYEEPCIVYIKVGSGVK